MTSQEPKEHRWKPGDQIVLRGVLNGRVLQAEPYTVVKDTAELIALWLPRGTVWMKPTGREEAVKKRLSGDWTLFRDEWRSEGLLRLTEPGRSYSVLIFWTPERTAVTRWYINIEEPFSRTDFGFDYLDQLLDVDVAGDRLSWRWKDEDEFEQAIELGLIDRPRAKELRAAAEEALDRVRRSQPPFTDEWRTWRPEPGWAMPSLPPDWDKPTNSPMKARAVTSRRTPTHPTLYPNVNTVLKRLVSTLQQVLDRNLIGVYLYGSLTTGDFDTETSDIDLLTVTAADIDNSEFDKLRSMHADLAHDCPEWDDRIEVAYVSEEALRTFRTRRSPVAVISPGEPFHRRDEGAGSDWLQNWYLVREFGVALFGPPPTTIIPPITREEFAQAVRDYTVRWIGWLKNAPTRNNQAYAILTMCRALYLRWNSEHVSKKQAALWAQSVLPRWSDLIGAALLWRSKSRDKEVDDGATYEETSQFLNEARELLDRESLASKVP